MNAKSNLSVGKPLFYLSAVAVALGLSCGTVFAAGTASDTASNYTGGWSASTTPNLGSGFGAWSVSDNDGGGSAPYAGTYLAGSGDTPIVDGGGNAWGTYANGTSGAFITLNRAFSTGGGSASLVNQMFSYEFNSSGIGGSGQSLVMNIGSAFTLSYAGGGSDNMTLSVGGGTANPISVNYANMAAGVNVALTVTGPVSSSTEGYSLVISPFAGGSPLYTGSGTFDSSTHDTSSFSFTLNNTGGNQYLNSLNIAAVPEPSSVAILGLSGLATLIAVRRRR